MIKLFCPLCILVILGLLIASCSSVSEVSDFKNQKIELVKTQDSTHINTYIWGYYLFGFYPIVSGSDENPGSTTFFRDTASADSAVKMLTAKASELGATSTTGISTEISSTGTFSFWIIYFCDAQASGNAIKK